MTSNTRWNDVAEMFHDVPLWKQADQLDRLIAFEEFIKQIDKKEQSLRKSERLRKERKRREQFTEFVKGLLKERKITN